MRPEIVPIISAMGWAVDSIMVRRGARTSSVLSAAYLSYLVTTILTWSYVVLNFPLSIVRSPAAFYFMASGTLQPLLARIFLYIGIERLGVARAMPLRGTGPIFSVAIAVLVLQERPSAVVYLGGLFVVAGGWMVSTEGARPPRAIGGLWTPSIRWRPDFSPASPRIFAAQACSSCRTLSSPAQ